jgi:lysophospholipase L1-like esterase
MKKILLLTAIFWASLGHGQPIYFWGDSYTEGTGIPSEEAFPAQVVALLEAEVNQSQPYFVLAKRGRTTAELLDLLPEQIEKPRAITVLIGVNDQYAGLPADSFSLILNELFETVQHLSQSAPVLVLSIPNYGLTPFVAQLAQGETDLDSLRADIAMELSQFNVILKNAAQKFQFDFLDISTHYQENGAAAENIAPDGLHPSKNIYAFWAEEIVAWLHRKEKR